MSTNRSICTLLDQSDPLDNSLMGSGDDFDSIDPLESIERPRLASNEYTDENGFIVHAQISQATLMTEATNKDDSSILPSCWCLTVQHTIMITSILVFVFVGGGIWFRSSLKENGTGGIQNDGLDCAKVNQEYYPDGQPDIYCQCQQLGHIADILPSTEQRYKQLQSIIKSALYPGKERHLAYSEGRFLNDTVFLGVTLDIHDCFQPKNMALLDLASRDSEDLERYALLVLYWSLQIVRTTEFPVHSKCDWAGIECKEDNRFSILLSRNLVNGTLPFEIGLLSRLESFVSNSNPGLVGAIPTEIGLLGQLKTLKLELGKLTGSIPTEVGRISLLETLRLSSNLLNSTIPTELALLKNLLTLNVEFNELRGTIPVEVTTLASLEKAALGENLLTGLIPTEIGNMVSLKILALTNTNLDPILPSQIWGLPSLGK